MGKIRTRVIGNEDVEEEQKKSQKKKSQEKKMAKSHSAEVVPVAEVPHSVPRPRDSAKGKKAKARLKGMKYREAKRKVTEKAISLDEAIVLLKKIKYAHFTESVEIHLNVTETGAKGEVDFPFSTGKTVKVAIVDDKLLEQIEEGKFDFDILITHPSFMPKLAKFARVLGPKGLMPNPKVGTISPNPEEMAKKFQKGLVKWKTEAKFPLIHQMIGKVSQDDKELVANATIFLQSVGRPRITSAWIKTTMSPSVKINLEAI